MIAGLIAGLICLTLGFDQAIAALVSLTISFIVTSLLFAEFL